MTDATKVVLGTILGTLLLSTLIIANLAFA